MCMLGFKNIKLTWCVTSHTKNTNKHLLRKVHKWDGLGCSAAMLLISSHSENTPGEPVRHTHTPSQRVGVCVCPQRTAQPDSKNLGSHEAHGLLLSQFVRSSECGLSHHSGVSRLLRSSSLFSWNLQHLLRVSPVKYMKRVFFYVSAFCLTFWHGLHLWHSGRSFNVRCFVWIPL